MSKGKYNINLSKYNQYYSLMGIGWSKLIDTPVKNQAGCSNEEAVARILWELTFDGWTEEKQQKRPNSSKSASKKLRKKSRRESVLNSDLPRKVDSK